MDSGYWIVDLWIYHLPSMIHTIVDVRTMAIPMEMVAGVNQTALYFNKMPLNTKVVLKRLWDNKMTRKQKSGQYGDYISCNGSFDCEGKRYMCFVSEKVADVLDSVEIGGEVEISTVAKEFKGKDGKMRTAKVFDCKVLKQSSSAPSLQQFTPLRMPSGEVKLNTHEADIFNMLWSQEENKEVQKEAESKYDYFSALMKANLVDYRTEEEMKQLWKLYKDFLFAKRESGKIVGMAHGRQVEQEIVS